MRMRRTFQLLARMGAREDADVPPCPRIVAGLQIEHGVSNDRYVVHALCAAQFHAVKDQEGRGPPGRYIVSRDNGSEIVSGPLERRQKQLDDVAVKARIQRDEQSPLP